MRTLAWSLATVALALMAGETRAAGIIGNLPPANELNYQYVSPGSAGSYAIEFTATAAETVNTATLIFTITQGASIPTVGIYSSSGGAIGTLVGGSPFTDATLSYGTTVHETYTGTAVLTSGSNYFLVVGDTAVPGGTFEWDQATPSGTLTGTGATFVGAGFEPGPYSSTNPIPNFELDGAATVPEPSSFVLAGLGGLLLLFAHRSIRKAPAALAA